MSAYRFVSRAPAYIVDVTSVARRPSAALVVCRSNRLAGGVRGLRPIRLIGAARSAVFLWGYGRPF